MFTLVGWTQSQDSAVLVATNALADQHVRINGTQIIVPHQCNKLIAAYGVGPNAARVQFVSPSLRRYLNLELSPLDIAATPSSPYPFVDLTSIPIELDEDEALDAYMAESGAGATRVTILAWLADQAPIPIGGDILTVRVTSSTTLVANAWTNGALTFDQSLPAGRYALVGGRMRSTGLQAWRTVFLGSPWRPGAVGLAADSSLSHPLFRGGMLGSWGEFTHNTPPSIDFLSNSADTSEVGYLDLLKVA